MKRAFKEPAVLALLVGGPFMMDLTLGLQVLYANLQTIDLGVPPRYQCLLAVAWSTGYVISSACAGRWCTPRRAGTMMIAALLGTAAVACSIFLVKPNYAFYLFASLISGLLVAFYFAPFQVKMGHIHPFRSLATVVAVYNVSWGSGIAFGFAGCGWFMEQPAAKLMACGTVAALAVAQSLLLLSVDANGGNREKASEEITSEFASTPLHRRCGWTGAFAGFLLFGGMSATLWPNLGRETGLSSARIGLGLFAIAAPLMLFSLLWARLCRCMRTPGLLLGLLGAMGLGYAALPLIDDWAWRCAMLAVIGTGFSGTIFHSVYYSNSDPASRERSVGINEAVVGTATLVGPMIMGWLAWDSGTELRPYIAGCALALVACIAIAATWIRGRDGP